MFCLHFFLHSDGAAEPDGARKAVVGAKILHYRQFYLNRPGPIAFMSVSVDTSVRIYDDFSRLLFLHAHREALGLAHELPEESDPFRFLRATCSANLRGSVGLILAKVLAIEDFYTVRFVISAFYTTTAIHSF